MSTHTHTHTHTIRQIHTLLPTLTHTPRRYTHTKTVPMLHPFTVPRPISYRGRSPLDKINILAEVHISSSQHYNFSLGNNKTKFCSGLWKFYFIFARTQHIPVDMWHFWWLYFGFSKNFHLLDRGWRCTTHNSLPLTFPHWWTLKIILVIWEVWEILSSNFAIKLKLVTERKTYVFWIVWWIYS